MAQLPNNYDGVESGDKVSKPSALRTCVCVMCSCLGCLVIVYIAYQVKILLTVDMCDVNGADYTYTETVAGSARTVVFNVCPNHYFDDGNLNPNSAYTTGDETIKMPANPMLEPSATVDLSGQGGGVGVLFNGATVYSAFAGSVELTGYSSSATLLEGDTFDKCGCHSASTTSAGYHCHIPPSCLLHQLGETTAAHSPQIGWAPDGFPIYGPRTVGGGKIKLCTQASNADSTYCMDACSGLEKEIPDLDDFTYRYYISGEDFLDGSHPDAPLEGTDSTDCHSGTDCINPLSTEPYYPFTPICYRGCCPAGVTCSGTSASIATCSGSATAGTTAAYSATAKYPAGLPVYTGAAYNATAAAAVEEVSSA